jgi:hypothetical protein
VVIAGNTLHWIPGNPVEDGSLELFSPPYLFKETSRPLVDHLDSTNLSYDSDLGIHWVSFTLPAPEIDRVVLIRPSSVTHTNNMEQRLVELVVTEETEGFLKVKTPATGRLLHQVSISCSSSAVTAFPREASGSGWHRSCRTESSCMLPVRFSCNCCPPRDLGATFRVALPPNPSTT